jgi:UPF0755 protein
MKYIKIIILIIIIFVGYLVYNYYSFLNSSAGTGESDIFVIETGEGARTIAKNLQEKSIINNENYFYYYLRLNKLSSKILAGDYELSPQMSPRKIAKVITSGQTVSREKTIKIIEGWRISDIDDYLSKNTYPRGTFTKLASTKNNFDDYREELSFLNLLPANSGLEGFMFPDTYRVYQDATVDDIAFKMLTNFETKISPELRAEILRQGKTLYEIVTMASLIEKEVRSEEDMKLVSGIFWNRINIGQALESCATLAFILGEDKPQYSVEDTEIINPYNTYQNPGLPPGPISNPGLKAIEAAIYPTPSDYYFFLSRFDNGETVFSKTYEEHLRNKAKYLN